MTSVFELSGERLYSPFRVLALVADDDGNAVLAYSMHGLQTRLMSRDHVCMVDFQMKKNWKWNGDAEPGSLRFNVEDLLSALERAAKKGGKNRSARMVYEGGDVLLVYPVWWQAEGAENSERVGVEKCELADVKTPTVVYDGHAVVGLGMFKKVVRFVSEISGLMRLQVSESDGGLRVQALDRMYGRERVLASIVLGDERIYDVGGVAEADYNPGFLSSFLSCFSESEANSLSIRLDVATEKVLRAMVEGDGWKIVYYQAPMLKVW